MLKSSHVIFTVASACITTRNPGRERACIGNTDEREGLRPDINDIRHWRRLFRIQRTRERKKESRRDDTETGETLPREKTGMSCKGKITSKYVISLNEWILLGLHGFAYNKLFHALPFLHLPDTRG